MIEIEGRHQLACCLGQKKIDGVFFISIFYFLRPNIGEKKIKFSLLLFLIFFFKFSFYYIFLGPNEVLNFVIRAK